MSDVSETYSIFFGSLEFVKACGCAFVGNRVFPKIPLAEHYIARRDLIGKTDSEHLYVCMVHMGSREYEAMLRSSDSKLIVIQSEEKVIPGRRGSLPSVETIQWRVADRNVDLVANCDKKECDEINRSIPGRTINLNEEECETALTLMDSEMRRTIASSLCDLMDGSLNKETGVSRHQPEFVRDIVSMYFFRNPYEY